MATAKKRSYDLGLRASQAEERRGAVLDAAMRLFMEGAYEDVSLQRVADEAGVALKTVVRQFGTKDALFMACARAHTPVEKAARALAEGEVAQVARVLAERYEALGEMTMRYIALEDRFGTIGEFLAFARQVHLEWLGRVFAPWLPARDGAARRQRLAQLFGATEIFVYWSWRQRLGLDRKTCEAAMQATLDALVKSWTTKTGG